MICQPSAGLAPFQKGLLRSVSRSEGPIEARPSQQWLVSVSAHFPGELPSPALWSAATQLGRVQQHPPRLISQPRSRRTEHE